MRGRMIASQSHGPHTVIGNHSTLWSMIELHIFALWENMQPPTERLQQAFRFEQGAVFLRDNTNHQHLKMNYF